MTRHALDIRAVTHRFGRTVALDAVDLKIEPGERVALLGHNGAGKTTLIRTMLGLLDPSDGSISVLGHAPGSIEARRLSAYLPEALAFHKSLTGREQLQLYCRLRGESVKRVPDLMDRVGLGDVMNQRIGTYSKGMRQRLGLAQLLLGSPRLMVLDEPTSGLDPVSRYDFYEIVSEMAANGAAVLMSSHVLTELEARTDRIVILSRGHVVADGPLVKLRTDAHLPIRVQVAAEPQTTEDIHARFGGSRVNGRTVELSVRPSEKVDRIAEITAYARSIEDIDIIPPSLEDLYRHYSAVSEQKEADS